MTTRIVEFENPIDRTGTGSLKWERFGADVIPMWVADMDFQAAPEIIEALSARVQHGVFGYTEPKAEVTQSVIDYLARVHEYQIEERWLIWLPGLVPALNVVCRAFAKPGEEVLTCSPVYPPFFSSPQNQGLKCVSSPMKLTEDRWTIDFEDLENRVTEKSRIFLLCNPHNPVATVFTPDELRKLGEFCIEHDLILCADEIHCDLLFSGESHTTMVSALDGIADRTITLMSPSKTYNLPGLSCAYAVIENPKLKAKFKQAAAGFITEINVFGYEGCRAAYEYGEAWRRELMSVLEKNRDYLFEFLGQEIPSIKTTPMQATYLAWLNIEELKRSHGIEDVVKHFAQFGVGLSAGADFGDSNFVRLNFGCAPETLAKGLERMLTSLKT